MFGILKVPSGQIGSTWEWYHWIGLERDINLYRFFNFLISFLNIWKDFNVLSCLMKKWIQPPACSDHGLHRILSSYFGLHTFIWWKNRPKCCSILVWIAGCWNSLLTSHNPKNNWCLSCILGARFSRKDRGWSTCKPWSRQAGGWIHFCKKQLRTLNSYQIFKIKKTYSGWCSIFQGLSNGTTLMQI